MGTDHLRTKVMSARVRARSEILDHRGHKYGGNGSLREAITATTAATETCRRAPTGAGMMLSEQTS